MEVYNYGTDMGNVEQLGTKLNEDKINSLNRTIHSLCHLILISVCESCLVSQRTNSLFL